jgi:hypothetical protein
MMADQEGEGAIHGRQTTKGPNQKAPYQSVLTSQGRTGEFKLNSASGTFPILVTGDLDMFTRLMSLPLPLRVGPFLLAVQYDPTKWKEQSQDHHERIRSLAPLLYNEMRLFGRHFLDKHLMRVMGSADICKSKVMSNEKDGYAF